MVAVFKDNDEIIVVGLNEDGSPMDRGGMLFGSKSNRDINTFERLDVFASKGRVVIIQLRKPIMKIFEK